MTEGATDILLVEDDSVFRTRLARAFMSRGLTVAEAGTPEEALSVAKTSRPRRVLVDLRMPGGSGLDLIAPLKSMAADTRVVVLTGYGNIASALEAVRLGAVNFLTKPADPDRILEAFDGVSAERPASDRSEVPSLQRVEWEHINRVMVECGGNVSRASKLLGIHRRSLQRKLAKYPGP